MIMQDSVRLNKFLAEQLGISRRQADDLIAAGKITVNGKTAILGQRVYLNIPRSIGSSSENSIQNPSQMPQNLPKSPQPLDKFDKVCYNGSIISPSVSYVYLGMNKPVGYLCSRRSQGGVPTVYELLPAQYQALKTVGRLDKDSSGLILLTNDGDFAFQMTHPKFQKTKLYTVTLDQPLQPLHQQEIADFGIEIGDGVSKMGLTRLSDDRKTWQVALHEGRNRQIRRTFAALGYTVTQLHRTQFGPYQLNNLPEGKFLEVPKASL